MPPLECLAGLGRAKMNLFMARQPILDTELKTWGYELLFRSGVENAFMSVENGLPDGDQATMAVLDSAFFSGLSQIAAGSKVLVNFTRHLLLNGYADILPKENVIIEILEDIIPDDPVLEACYRLKNAGYTLALDDFQYSTRIEPLLSIVDIIKVDFIQSGIAERMELAHALLPLNIRLLAEKVETREEFEQARDLGYTLFQGYFFSKPQVVQGARMPESKMAKMRLLREVNRPEISVDAVTAVIKSDPGMTMRLLRYLNSAFFGVRNKITSIRQAVVMMGRSNLRKWATVLAIAEVSGGKPPELLKQAVFRARFCELLGEMGRSTNNSDDFFIVGMLSLVEALVDQPRDMIIAEMSLNDETKGVLMNTSTGTLLCDSLHIAEGVEGGHWFMVDELAQHYNISQDVVANAYREAILMADSFMRLSGSTAEPAAV